MTTGRINQVAIVNTPWHNPQPPRINTEGVLHHSRSQQHLEVRKTAKMRLTYSDVCFLADGEFNRTIIDNADDNSVNYRSFPLEISLSEASRTKSM